MADEMSDKLDDKINQKHLKCVGEKLKRLSEMKEEYHKQNQELAEL